MMHLIIAGSRGFNDYELVENFMMDYLGHLIGKIDIEVISGGCARGADRLGERFAREHGLGLRVVRADWAGRGLAAGPQRNEQMARMAGTLVAFWDGKSSGTRDMIRRGNKYCQVVKVVRTDLIAK